jgi:hypothetical protein
MYTLELNIANCPSALGVIAFGFLFSFSGYKFFRMSVFCFGCVAGTILLDPYVRLLSTKYQWPMITSGGLLFGLLSYYIYKAFICAVLVAVGTLFSLTLTTVVANILQTTRAHSLFISLAVSIGLVGITFALKYVRLSLILVTTLIGTVLTVWGSSMSLGVCPCNELWYDVKYQSTWEYWTGGFLLFILGSVSQLKQMSYTMIVPLKKKKERECCSDVEIQNEHFKTTIGNLKRRKNRVDRSLTL